MITSKPAPSSYPIHKLIQNRWSGRAFLDKPVEEEKLNILLEAARWAPSSFNEQPWQYVVGKKGDRGSDRGSVDPDIGADMYDKLASCLMEGNSWAKKAPVLMLSVAKTFFEHKHKPNRHYMHDTGAASVLMAIQATDLDLMMHQMAGYDVEKARELFEIDEDYEPAAMIAIGYPAGPDRGDNIPEELKESESSERRRKEPEDMIWKAK